MDDADAVLVQQACTGNKDAFGLLITRYERLTWRFTTRLIADPEVAQEVIQEAMLEAYLSLAKLHDPARFRSWFYGIILNLSRSYWRRQKISVVSLEGDLAFDALEFDAGSPDPAQLAEAHELHQIVLNAVQLLSPRNRATVLLFYYDGLNLTEIAAVLGITLTAVKGRLHKSRNELRVTLLPALELELARSIPIQERNQIMVRVKLIDVVPSQDKKPHFAVVLKDEAGQRILPIWVGEPEGTAIGAGLRHLQTARPLTFDFMSKILTAAGATLEEVRIEQLKDQAFYAIAKIRTGKTVQEIDARPSDALALAVRTNSPILVAEEVFELAGFPIPAEAGNLEGGKGLDLISEQINQAQDHWRSVSTSPLNPAVVEKSRQALLDHLFG